MTTYRVFSNSNLLTQVSSLVFDDYGYLYASNFNVYGNGTIIKIDKNGNGTLLTDLGNIYHISCITYYNNYLYASAFPFCEYYIGNGYVYKVDINNGTYTICYTSPHFVCPTGLVFYNSFLYVLFYMWGRLIQRRLL